MLVLSIFPGIGLLDRAFEEVGFCIVRGPDALWGGDIRRFAPPVGKFDGIIGGPPCQRFSSFAGLVRSVHGEEALAPNLIPEFERCVDTAQPVWFLMENVPAAPEPCVLGYAVKSFVLNNRSVPDKNGVGGIQNRERRWSFGVQGKQAVDLERYLEFAALVSPEFEPAVMSSGQVKRATASDRNARFVPGTLKVKVGASARSVASALELQGLPPDFLSDAPFTVGGKQKVIGNGVPLPMGRALANAVKKAVETLETL